MDERLPVISDTLLPAVAQSQPRIGLTLEQCIGSWLAAKWKRSESQRTKKLYREQLDDFRLFLHTAHPGCDLDGPGQLISPTAQIWADYNKKTQEQGVSPSTFRLRISVLSSFYDYALLRSLVLTNPMKQVERPNRKIKYAASALPQESVKEQLKKIDRSTLPGKRDYAVLSIALETTRRVAELAALRMCDIERLSEEYCKIHWERCKGNKTRDDIIKAGATRVLFDYLEAYYGTQGYASLKQVPGDAPVWISFSPHNTGEAVTTKTLQRISEKWLGDSRFHITRHTGAIGMLRNGAPLDKIKKQLGHEHISTTALYLDDKQPNDNAYGTVLEDVFGIGQ